MVVLLVLLSLWLSWDMLKRPLMETSADTEDAPAFDDDRDLLLFPVDVGETNSSLGV